MKWEDADLDSALRELREEELPPAALAATRSRVLARVKHRRAVNWLALAAVAALLVLVTSGAYRFLRPVEALPSLSLARPAVADEAFRVPERTAAPVRLRVRQIPSVARPAVSREFVQLITDDPDVVILWAVDSKGVTE